MEQLKNNMKTLTMSKYDSAQIVDAVNIDSVISTFKDLLSPDYHLDIYMRNTIEDHIKMLENSDWLSNYYGYQEGEE